MIQLVTVLAFVLEGWADLSPDLRVTGVAMVMFTTPSALCILVFAGLISEGLVVELGEITLIVRPAGLISLTLVVRPGDS